MTDLTNNNAADEGLLHSFFASIPTVAEVIEAGTALAIGVLLSVTLHVML